MTATHTATPWHVTDKSPRKIKSASGATIANLTALDIENAEFIVLCCNAHNDLIWAAEEAKLAVQSILILTRSPSIRSELLERLYKIAATLEKAGAK